MNPESRARNVQGKMATKLIIQEKAKMITVFKTVIKEVTDNIANKQIKKSARKHIGLSKIVF